VILFYWNVENISLNIQHILQTILWFLLHKLHEKRGRFLLILKTHCFSDLFHALIFSVFLTDLRVFSLIFPYFPAIFILFWNTVLEILPDAVFCIHFLFLQQ